MYERSHVSVKSRTSINSTFNLSTLRLACIYLRDYNLRALTCVAKNASVEIKLDKAPFNWHRESRRVRLLSGLTGIRTPSFARQADANTSFQLSWRAVTYTPKDRSAASSTDTKKHDNELGSVHNIPGTVQSLGKQMSI